MHIVDTHFHLWQRRDVTPAGIMAAPYLSRDFTWDDYRHATRGLDVVRAIHVQVQNDTEHADRETAAVEALGAAQPVVSGMVAWAPLESPDVGPRIARLAQSGRVVGVRRLTQQEPDPLFCARPAFIAGARLLAAHGLVCEVCVLETQLAGVIGLARACPEVTIVLDHLGKPRHLMQPPSGEWLDGMGLLGECPGVICKLAPTLYDLADPPLRASGVRPFVEHVVSVFGWDRIIFGSNWPPSSAIVGCREWVEMLQGILSGTEPSRLDALFSGNACRLFGLERSETT